MKVNLEYLQKIRKETLVSFHLCKEALLKTNNNYAKALEWLHKEGATRTRKEMKQGTSGEGFCQIFVEDDWAFLLELNCETDFVADNALFKAFFQKIVHLISQKKILSMEELQKSSLEGEQLMTTLLKLSRKFGEELSFGHFLAWKKEKEENFVYYNHSNHKNSALLVLKSETDYFDEQEMEILAMHVVAMEPQFINWKNIPLKFVTKEKEIVKAMLEKKLDKKLDQAKKVNIINRTTEKNLRNLSLLTQSFVKFPKLTVEQYLNQKKLVVSKMIWLKIGKKIYEC